MSRGKRFESARRLSFSCKTSKNEKPTKFVSRALSAVPQQ
jgi:hypothetical protein